VNLSDEELAAARAAVADWREQHPEGTEDQLVAALNPGPDPDYGLMLRAMLFAIDRATRT
jgi:hypothetical protein